MVVKRLSHLLVLAVLCIPTFGVALASTDEAATAENDANSLLSAFIAYTDLRIRSVQRSVEILAAATETRSANWSQMKDLLNGYQQSDEGLIVWYARPDGAYFTADEGLMDKTLTDRVYFPDLMAGTKITGALVVSKATGQRSAIIAVPVEDNGKVVGAVGVSLFLDKLSEQLSTALNLRPGMAFFALAPDGLTTLHRKTDRHFLDPRKLGSESLRSATTEMLAGTSGKTTYEFDNTIKRAIYGTSALTGWKFAIAFGIAPADEH